MSATKEADLRIVELSGGVGGARLARGLAQVPGVELTVVVNVGDDDVVHGLNVSPDLDTVVYTLAGVEGPEGWGRAGDTFTVNDELGRLGADNRFRLGDLDLALNVIRTSRLRAGDPLSAITRDLTDTFGIDATVIPSTDGELATKVKVAGGEWISFQEYFVLRSNQDRVEELRFAGSGKADPAPGVIEAIETADMIVVGPSNPPLSIWPILAVEKINQSVSAHPNVVAVSPLIGNKALKGPADRVMSSLGLAPGNVGVAEAYHGLIDRLVIHTDDADDATLIEVEVSTENTIIKDPAAARSFAARLLSL